jgi:hypothetical protein
MRNGLRLTCLLLAASLVPVLGLAILGPTPARADGLSVIQFTPSVLDFAGHPAVLVRGLIRNDTGVAAGDIQVAMHLRRSPGGEELVPPGFGKSWLGTLSPGETGPFQTLVHFCCPEEIGHYEFEVEWRGTSVERYRAVEAQAGITRTVDGLNILYGELINTGTGFTDASTTRVYIGFFQGDRFVDGRSALVPVFFEDGEGGVGQPPGFRLPWSTSLPDLPYDRIELWPAVEAFPPGDYPVPLGIRDTAIEPAARGITVSGTLRNCGTQPVEDVVLLVVARDSAGQLLQFDKVYLSATTPILPGSEGRVSVGWTTARPELLDSQVTMSAFSLQQQAERPADQPCGGPRASVYLPRVLNR